MLGSMGIVCNLYSRLFSIISNKDESLADVLIRKEEQFSWDFQFRRRLFIWEVEELDSLTAMLDTLHINIGDYPDHLVWNACNSKSYSVSSMYKLSLCQVSTAETLEKKTFHWIWRNAAPYRVQCFGWMVQLGKLKTGEFLLRIGIIQQHDHALCKFCGEVIESLNHSLLLCLPVWNVWGSILNWWGIQWVTPNSIPMLFAWWINFKQKPKAALIWDCIPLAILWSIWKMRNEFIFENRDIIWDEVVDLIKLRIALWARAKWEPSDYSLNDFIYRLPSILASL